MLNQSTSASMAPAQDPTGPFKLSQESQCLLAALIETASAKFPDLANAKAIIEDIHQARESVAITQAFYHHLVKKGHNPYTTCEEIDAVCKPLLSQDPVACMLFALRENHQPTFELMLRYAKAIDECFEFYLDPIKRFFYLALRLAMDNANHDNVTNIIKISQSYSCHTQVLIEAIAYCVQHKNEFLNTVFDANKLGSFTAVMQLGDENLFDYCFQRIDPTHEYDLVAVQCGRANAVESYCSYFSRSLNFISPHCENFDDANYLVAENLQSDLKCLHDYWCRHAGDLSFAEVISDFIILHNDIATRLASSQQHQEHIPNTISTKYKLVNLLRPNIYCLASECIKRGDADVNLVFFSALAKDHLTADPQDLFQTLDVDILLGVTDTYFDTFLAMSFALDNAFERHDDAAIQLLMGYRAKSSKWQSYVFPADKLDWKKTSARLTALCGAAVIRSAQDYQRCWSALIERYQPHPDADDCVELLIGEEPRLSMSSVIESIFYLENDLLLIRLFEKHFSHATADELNTPAINRVVQAACRQQRMALVKFFYARGLINTADFMRNFDPYSPCFATTLFLWSKGSFSSSQMVQLLVQIEGFVSLRFLRSHLSAPEEMKAALKDGCNVLATIAACDPFVLQFAPVAKPEKLNNQHDVQQYVRSVVVHRCREDNELLSQCCALIEILQRLKQPRHKSVTFKAALRSVNHLKIARYYSEEVLTPLECATYLPIALPNYQPIMKQRAKGAVYASCYRGFQNQRSKYCQEQPNSTGFEEFMSLAVRYQDKTRLRWLCHIGIQSTPAFKQAFYRDPEIFTIFLETKAFDLSAALELCHEGQQLLQSSNSLLTRFSDSIGLTSQYQHVCQNFVALLQALQACNAVTVSFSKQVVSFESQHIQLSRQTLGLFRGAWFLSLLDFPDPAAAIKGVMTHVKPAPRILSEALARALMARQIDLAKLIMDYKPNAILAVNELCSGFSEDLLSCAMQLGTFNMDELEQFFRVQCQENIEHPGKLSLLAAKLPAVKAFTILLQLESQRALRGVMQGLQRNRVLANMLQTTLEDAPLVFGQLCHVGFPMLTTPEYNVLVAQVNKFMNSKHSSQYPELCHQLKVAIHGEEAEEETADLGVSPAAI